MVQEERNNKTDFIPILGYHYTQVRMLHWAIFYPKRNEHDLLKL